jgi:hypothetical protein
MELNKQINRTPAKQIWKYVFQQALNDISLVETCCHCKKFFVYDNVLCNRCQSRFEENRMHTKEKHKMLDDMNKANIFELYRDEHSYGGINDSNPEKVWMLHRYRNHELYAFKHGHYYGKACCIAQNRSGLFINMKDFAKFCKRFRYNPFEDDSSK